MRVYGGGAYPAYIVDTETLREELLSEEDTLEWLQEMPEDPHAPSFWRMLGELDRALETGEARLAEQEPGTASWGAAALRLAQAHHWREEFAQAHELLAAVEEMLGDDPWVQGAVLHQRATVLLDQGRWEQAHADAARAVSLRERSGDPEVLSSREVVERVRRARRTTEDGGGRPPTV